MKSVQNSEKATAKNISAYVVRYADRHLYARYFTKTNANMEGAMAGYIWHLGNTKLNTAIVRNTGATPIYFMQTSGSNVFVVISHYLHILRAFHNLHRKALQDDSIQQQAWLYVCVCICLCGSLSSCSGRNISVFVLLKIPFIDL